ncbi:wiskott-Aldrich syndrome protein family member 3-like isoform X3 [Rhinatrema bivittatum]|uniref:wiskott-Aldrich syndrome protein family member 3-like isoform X3 n=1 Tax=Rhinatrema bivittatum TaxID=194408 RepID=UPI00112737BD|nr:wiskott-Aldrich syndrome protein family member 3-like isoform X3 [Rhinatrema bivittatum]
MCHQQYPGCHHQTAGESHCREQINSGPALVFSMQLKSRTNESSAAFPIIIAKYSRGRHAEDIFGELFNEANSFYLRMNSLQERVDLLVIKVTQLDSTVEEVSLQDINMRKAFKSSTIQNQQVVSRNSIPNPVMEMYQRCDKPPPLNILTPYRDDRKDGLKFYTDPSYFFSLWKEKMLQATEDKRKEKRRQKEQRLVEDATREVKKVRKARNRRLEWNMMAYDKEFRPDNRSFVSDVGDHSYPASPNHPVQQIVAPVPHLSSENKELILVTQMQEHGYRPSAAGSRQNSLNRVQQQHIPQPPEAIMNGPRPQLLKEYGSQQMSMVEYFVPPAPPPPPPMIPSAQTAFDSPISAPPPLAPSVVASMALSAYTPTPPPPPPCPYSVSPQTGPLGPPVAPPPPPPGPPTVSASPAHSASPPAITVEPRKPQIPLIPVSDARSDLLAAIRRGIQLRKVQEQREQEAKKEPVGNDVATILSRRIAVEYSESDDDSELDENEWSD